MGKHNLRKTGIAISSFFIVGLFLSTAIAIPLTNDELVMKQLQGNDYPSWSDIVKYSNIYKDNTTLIKALNEKRNVIVAELNKNYTLKQRNFIIGYFFDGNVNNILNINEIRDNVNKLNTNDFLNSVQGLVGIPDNYNEFNNSYNRDKMLLLINYVKDNGVSPLGFIGPFISLYSWILMAIASIWVVPLMMAFSALGIGDAGLIIGTFLTIIFFSKSLFLMSFIVGFENMCLGTDFVAVLLEYGWVVALPYGMFLMLTGYWELGLVYILFQFLMTSFDFNPHGWTMGTGENPPEVYGWSTAIDGTTHDVCFDLYVNDIDTVTCDSKILNRDWMQLGFDWDNDMNPDYWTSFHYKDTLDDTPILISAFHNFDVGSHTVNCWIRDNWGATSEPIVFSFDITNDMNQGINLYVNQPLQGTPVLR